MSHVLGLLFLVLFVGGFMIIGAATYIDAGSGWTLNRFLMMGFGAACMVGAIYVGKGAVAESDKRKGSR
jgi:hypothetical protein